MIKILYYVQALWLLIPAIGGLLKSFFTMEINLPIIRNVHIFFFLLNIVQLLMMIVGKNEFLNKNKNFVYLTTVVYLLLLTTLGIQIKLG